MGLNESSIPNYIKRRIKLIPEDELLKMGKLSYGPAESLMDNVNTALNVMTNNTFDTEEYFNDEEVDDELFEEWWYELKDYYDKKYFDKLEEYFIARRDKYESSFEQDYHYVIRKHENRDINSAGYGETFKDFYVIEDKFSSSLPNVDFDSVKEKLDNNPDKWVVISEPKDNKYGYYFSLKRVSQ